MLYFLVFLIIAIYIASTIISVYSLYSDYKEENFEGTFGRYIWLKDLELSVIFSFFPVINTFIVFGFMTIYICKKIYDWKNQK